MAKKQDEDFEIKPSISASDKDFRNKIGVEGWEKIKSKTLRDNGYKCKGCGFEPFDAPIDAVLDVHLVEENLNNLEDSEFRVDCKLCHIIEHADVAISNEYVSIVNSRFSQGELVNICRNGSLSSHVSDGDVRYLKKTLQEFLEEIKNGRSLEGRVKFVFTNKCLRRFDIIHS